IASMMILATLVLPAFSRAKAAGRSAVRKSNLHQIGLALEVYVDDSQAYPGFVPTAPRFAGGILWEQVLQLSDSNVIRCPERQDWKGGLVAVSVDRGQRPVVVSHGGYGYNAYGCAPNTQLRVGLAGLYAEEQRLWHSIPEAGVRSPVGLIALG